MCTCGMRRSSCMILFLCDGCVDSHSGRLASPPSWSLISICCQKTGPARTSAQACARTHTHTQVTRFKTWVYFSLTTVPPRVQQSDWSFYDRTLQFGIYSFKAEMRTSAKSYLFFFIMLFDSIIIRSPILNFALQDFKSFFFAHYI